MATPVQPTTPSLMEIMQAAQMMQPHPPAAQAPVEKDAGLTKTIVGGVVVLIGFIMLGLFGWVGTSVNGLNTTVTKMSANVDQLQKSIADLQQTQGTATQQLSDVRATNAKQDARQDAHDAEIVRMKERLRIVEGQAPLRGSAGGM